MLKISSNKPTGFLKSIKEIIKIIRQVNARKIKQLTIKMPVSFSNLLVIYRLYWVYMVNLSFSYNKMHSYISTISDASTRTTIKAQQQQLNSHFSYKY